MADEKICPTTGEPCNCGNHEKECNCGYDVQIRDRISEEPDLCTGSSK
ncbi:MAG: hypothetical protein ABIC04_02280 [Nanoarchaeota archaeon]